MRETLVVHPKYQHQAEQLRQLLSRFDEVGEMVVDGDRNTIKKVLLGNTMLNIKRFKTPNLFQGLVYRFLRKSKAQRSFEYAEKLHQASIRTPAPVAYSEAFGTGLKSSFYVSEHLDYDFDFRTLNHNPLWPDRAEILRQFAGFTFQLHENQIRFLDHSPGNTLIKDNGDGTYHFFLIDLNRMRFGTMNLAQRMKNFRRMWLSKTMINIMAPEYARLHGTTSEETHRLMTYYSRKFQKKVNSKKVRKRRRR
ncbi:MAG: lipopolysaccharide kinase InaA family protein [Bacteroidota bacterium]